jgi:N,N-dimethylformamidase
MTAPSSPAKLLAYASALAVSPGDTLALKVSSAASYSATIVRPSGLGGAEDLAIREFRLPPSAHHGRRQRAQPGSYMRVEECAELGRTRSAFTVSAWVLPTLPVAGRMQSVIARWHEAHGGFWLGLDEQGYPELRVGSAEGGVRVRDRQSVRPYRWTCLSAAYRSDGGQLWLASTPSADLSSVTRRRVGERLSAEGVGPLLVAAALRGTSEVAHFFDGKISGPVLLHEYLEPEAVTLFRSRDAEVSGTTVAWWDFSLEPGGQRVFDHSGNGLEGRLYNLPTRAVTGPNWTGRTLDYRAAPEQYDAIHFHSDDLGDHGWATDLETKVPMHMKSDVYSFHLQSGNDDEWVPFVVLPDSNSSEVPVLVILPTFTYLAYANDTEVWPEYGLSLYDHHRDGSGVTISSARRPLPTLSPRYIAPTTGAPRNFSLDLSILDWLRNEGIGFDVITDGELTQQGQTALNRYRIVITGSHPEYVSEAELEAFSQYISDGGRIMYLGGNGFYWVASEVAGEDAIEVRRGQAGSRAWESLPGEVHHASTGEPGGLWRHRGRPPQKVLGVGFCGQGTSKAFPYRRTSSSYDPLWDWIFAGVESEVFGDAGAVLGGAAGDEVDCISRRLGTPNQTVVLATANIDDPAYELTIEEVWENGLDQGANRRGLVRSDLTITPYGSGGAVLAVGSMAWVGALPLENFDNPVARVTKNVLQRFLVAEPFEPGPNEKREGVPTPSATGPPESVCG